jgi:hypothetical protein
VHSLFQLPHEKRRNDPATVMQIPEDRHVIDSVHHHEYARRG